MARFLSGLNAFREEEDVHASTRDVHRSTPVPQSSGQELTRGSRALRERLSTMFDWPF